MVPSRIPPGSASRRGGGRGGRRGRGAARFSVACATALAAWAPASADAAKPVRVVVLAGQSNMVGFGDPAELPPDLASQEDVWYDHHNPAARDGGPYAGATSTDWEPLAPMGTPAVHGPEITFGHAVAAARPEAQLALVKMSMSGTNILEHWARGLAPSAEAPAKSQLYHALLGDLDSATYSEESGNALLYPAEETRVDAALARLAADGAEYRVSAVLWMQGENEAGWDAASGYEDTLTALIAAWRQDLGEPKLPVVLGRISDNLYAKNGGPIPASEDANVDAVRAAQEAVAEADPFVEWVDTDDLPPRPGDPYHFSSEGYRTLGERFAVAYLALAPPLGGGGSGGSGSSASGAGTGASGAMTGATSGGANEASGAGNPDQPAPAGGEEGEGCAHTQSPPVRLQAWLALIALGAVAWWARSTRRR